MYRSPNYFEKEHSISANVGMGLCTNIRAGYSSNTSPQPINKITITFSAIVRCVNNVIICRLSSKPCIIIKTTNTIVGGL